MSDYLTRLVGRAVGVVPSTEPPESRVDAAVAPDGARSDDLEPSELALAPALAARGFASRRLTPGRETDRIVDSPQGKQFHQVRAGAADLAVSQVEPSGRPPARSDDAEVEAAAPARTSDWFKSTPAGKGGAQPGARRAERLAPLPALPAAGSTAIADTERLVGPSDFGAAEMRRSSQAVPREPRSTLHADEGSRPSRRTTVLVRPRLPIASAPPPPVAREAIAAQVAKSPETTAAEGPVDRISETQVSVHIGTFEIKAVSPPPASRPEPPSHPAGFDGYRLMRSYLIRGG
jgi:hypothetical protein